MHYKYSTKGVCSSSIDFDIQDNVIQNIRFTGGCSANLEGISRLIIGMDPKEAAKRLAGIKCGMRGTSCPDQLSKALADFVHDNA